MIPEIKECIALFTAKEIAEFIAISFAASITLVCIAEFFVWAISGAVGALMMMVRVVKDKLGRCAARRSDGLRLEPPTESQP